MSLSFGFHWVAIAFAVSCAKVQPNHSLTSGLVFGDDLIYPWGTAWPPPEGSGNFDSSISSDLYDKTSKVGQFNPTAYGLYDLSGNAWEWCDSLYNPKETDAEAPTWRVLRGGSWISNDPSNLLSSFRYYYLPTGRNDINGFRVVLGVGGGG